MAVTSSQMLHIAMTLGLFSVTQAAVTRTFLPGARLNVGVPEERENSTPGRNSKLNVGAPQEDGNANNVMNEQFVVIAATELLNFTGERNNGLNVVAPEEIGHLANPVIVINFDTESVNKIGGNEVLSDSGLNLGVPGDLESGDLFGGDIILTPDQAKDWNTRKAVTFAWNLWPRKSGIPTVFYAFGNTLVPKSTILGAIKHYEDHTCIRFRRSFWPFHLGPQIIFKNGDGCSSMVGRQFLNIFGQDISLAEGCDALPTVIHEIGHAVGLYHEQGRSDRDAFVKVIPSNLKSGMEYNFNKVSTRNYETTYDYYSVMQYGPLSFSRNGDTTLTATDPMAHGLMIRSRSGFSFMDKLILNRMYGCVDQWVSQCSGISSDPCNNMGYLGPDCQCVCPAGTSGANCETKTMSYTGALIKELLPLNEQVTSPATISSPSYPSPQLPSVVFTKIITAPTCKVVKLTVIGFTMFQRYPSQRCSSEGVEIRLGDPVTSGKWFCGSELKTGDTFQSEGSTMVLFYIKGTMTSNNNAGFSFSITFQAVPSCR